MLRKKYPELDLNLIRYDSSIGSKWGGRGTPDGVKAEARKHQIRTATRVTSVEAMRELLANGYGLNTCSNLGFESTRKHDGVSNRRGSWGHSQAIIGVDDRPGTVEKYNGMLFLWQNSWGKWNSGPRTIRGTAIKIPHGAYWVSARTTRMASVIAFSGDNGWPRRDLPDYGATGVI